MEISVSAFKGAKQGKKKKKKQAQPPTNWGVFDGFQFSFIN